MKYVKSGLVFGGALMMCAAAHASDPFSMSASITNGNSTQTVTESFKTVESVVDTFQNNQLSSIANTYTQNSGVNAQVSYMGVPVNLAYAQNSTTLTFSVPGLGLTETFTGTTRDDSAKQFLSFLKGQGMSVVNEFQRYLVANSTISPIAGNPGSLQSSMVNTSFATGAFNTAGNVSEGGASGGRFGIGVSGGEFSVNGYSGTQATLPISYAYRFSNPGWQLQFNMPLSFQQVGGAQSYAAQLGVGLQIPILPGVDWYLIPTISGGVTGSADLGAAGLLYSYALNSRYTYHVNSDFAVTLGNMIGRVNSANVKVSGYSIDPGVNNTVVKNGVEAEYKTKWNWWGGPLSVRGGVAYTQAYGSQLAIPHYTEVFFDFGTVTSSNAAFYKRLRIGATYTTGCNYHAGSLNLGYTF
ncbi:hypothetical protein [Trinickia dinghuensis]|uniref:Long-chain fatty acid transporter n=1 Tax=Trinickia dinghuensis TaxID=2291023 RepID=A0A3D8JRH7_9BURK|nr:hypothetical protein [Trinickia dinghuensis]RDU95144.1 hypothetical protein DWV00_30655 [Trinickia dinghuensis]